MTAKGTMAKATTKILVEKLSQIKEKDGNMLKDWGTKEREEGD